MTALGEFARCQPDYAARGLPTFPVSLTRDGKKPAVANYLRIGRPASAELAQRFSTIDAFGLALGARNGLTVLDCDSTDERVFADAVARHGKSPLIIRSGSGHYQAWYRWNGERRAIRPRRDVPVDILGSGFVVAPTSKGPKGQYQIIEGSLDDLANLPTLNTSTDVGSDALRATSEYSEAQNWNCLRDGNGRNDKLFRQLGREVRACDDFDQLLDRARWLNEHFAEPMDDARVTATARSVWRMTEDGRNRFGEHGAWFNSGQVLALTPDPHLGALLMYLKAQNGPDAVFMVADGLRETPAFSNWSRREFVRARRQAIDGGWISVAAKPTPNRAARYVWGSPIAVTA